MIQKIILCCVLIFPASALAYGCDSLRSLHWMLGPWSVVETTDGSDKRYGETWQSVSPISFEGFGVALTPDGKSQKLNSLRLLEMSGGIFYLAKFEQAELPVIYRLTSCGERQAVFENLSYDFPQTIRYQLKDTNLLSVKIAGMGEEVTKREYTLNFTRSTGAQ